MTVSTAKLRIATHVAGVIDCDAESFDTAKLYEVLKALGVSTSFVDDDPTTCKLKQTWLTALQKVQNPQCC